MINLLPPAVKESYRFGRRNVGLRKWLIYCVIALVGLLGITTYGALSIHQSIKHYEQQTAAAEATLQKDKFPQTQKQVKDTSNSFKLVVQVLSNQVLFSKLIQQIGATIPPNATLGGLTINQTQSALDITAKAKDYATATQVQVNLNDPSNKIFSKADIISISCSNGADQASSTSDYPCTVSVRALFAPNNPYLFVNSKGVKP